MVRGVTQRSRTDYLAGLADKLGTLDIKEFCERGLDGKAMGQAIRGARLQLIKQEQRSAP